MVPEVVEVEDRHVSCAGGAGASGHPKVYLAIGEESKVTCPYCSRVFVLKNSNA